MLIKRKLQQHWPWVLLLASALIIVVVLFSLRIGAIEIEFTHVFEFLFSDKKTTEIMVLRELRFPRSMLAILVGALLACSGAITQGLFRNPLADPSLIGVSAGAAAGASIMIVLVDAHANSVLGLSFVSLGAFAGSAVTVWMVYRIATGPGDTSVTTMLLAGIAIAFFVSSLTGTLEYIADHEMLRRLSLWRMGGLDAATDIGVILAVGVVCLYGLVLPSRVKALNAMLLGESEARHLGINVNRLKKVMVMLVALGVGVSVALAGTIAFVGLVVPHMCRLLVGPDHRFLLPLSAALGAILLLIADTFARTILSPSELPVGLVTAFLGAPVFISLLRNRRTRGT